MTAGTMAGASTSTGPSAPAPPEPGAPRVRRIRKGMRAADLAPGGDAGRALTGVAAIDSPFQLQEYLSLVLADVAARGAPPSHEDVERIVRLPSPSGFGAGDKDDTPPALDAPRADGGADAGADEPHSVELDVWIYEHLRRVVQDLGSTLVPALQAVCLPPSHGGGAGCAAMNAGAWMFLCAAHGDGERQCPAIDYTQHTLDAITSTLVAPRLFPSRTYVPATSLRHFASIARRISRIFLHAREHHRDIFDATEAETLLYDRFYTLCKRFELTQIDGLPVPPALAQARSQAQAQAQAQDIAPRSTASHGRRTGGDVDRATTFDRRAFTFHGSRGGPARSAGLAGRTPLSVPALESGDPAGPIPGLLTRARTTSAASDASSASTASAVPVPTVLGLQPTRHDTEDHGEKDSSPTEPPSATDAEPGLSLDTSGPAQPIPDKPNGQHDGPTPPSLPPSTEDRPAQDSADTPRAPAPTAGPGARPDDAAGAVEAQAEPTAHGAPGSSPGPATDGTAAPRGSADEAPAPVPSPTLTPGPAPAPAPAPASGPGPGLGPAGASAPAGAPHEG